MSGAGRTRGRWTIAAGVAALGRTAGMTGLVFASAALLALWIAGPRYEASVTVTGPDTPARAADVAALGGTQDFAEAVVRRIGRGGAVLGAPSLIDRIAAMAGLGQPEAGEGTAGQRLTDSVSIESAGLGSGITVSALGDDAPAARALAEAAAAELADRLRESLSPSDAPVTVALQDGPREIPQPFLPVALVAGLIGTLAGAASSVLGRLAWTKGRSRPANVRLDTPSDGGGSKPDAVEPRGTLTEAATLSAETVTLAEIAAALAVEPVSCALVARAATAEATGAHLARVLARTGGSVLLLDFANAPISVEGAQCGAADGQNGQTTNLEIVPVRSAPSALSEDDRSILSEAGDAYDHVIVDCADLPASEVALLADEDSAVLLVGTAYAVLRESEFRDAGLATLVLAG